MTLLQLDRYAHLNSPLHRLDPRAKLVGFLVGVVAIASASPRSLGPYPWFYAVVLILILASRAPKAYFLRRCLFAAPFILMAAALPWVSFALERYRLPEANAATLSPALILALKAFAAILLLALLTATTRVAHLLWALRRLHAPEVLNTLASLMQRYSFLLMDEWARTTRARQSRSAGGLRLRRTEVYGKQFAMIFLRSWDRAERIHWAMLSRGFNGVIPVLERFRFAPADLAFLLLLSAAWLGTRFLAA